LSIKLNSVEDAKVPPSLCFPLAPTSIVENFLSASATPCNTNEKYLR